MLAYPDRVKPIRIGLSDELAASLGLLVNPVAEDDGEDLQVDED
jgi:hypothetical protein